MFQQIEHYERGRHMVAFDGYDATGRDMVEAGETNDSAGKN